MHKKKSTVYFVVMRLAFELQADHHSPGLEQRHKYYIICADAYYCRQDGHGGGGRIEP